MSEKKIATRDSYGAALVEYAANDPEIVVLDADLAAATKTGMFKKAFPERFIDCGIAECDMIGVAAGLAAAGKKVFASSFAMFAAGRAYEVIRNSVGYPHLPVKICATHAGISVGEDGATHQCCEDIGLMRTIPQMVIINPCDDRETKQAVFAAYEHNGPVYMRFGRLALPNVTTEEYKFELGKGVTMREGNDVTIIETSSFGSNEIKDKAIEAYTKKVGAHYIYIGDLNKDPKYLATGLFWHDGVAGHPGDFGMQTIANRIIDCINENNMI